MSEIRDKASSRINYAVPLKSLCFIPIRVIGKRFWLQEEQLYKGIYYFVIEM